jgi:hypothetical protein
MFFSCTDFYLRDLNNPVDPEAPDYQGYETVENPDDIKPVGGDAGELFFPPLFLAEKVVGATAYQFQMADNAGFAPVLWTSSEASENELLPTALGYLYADTTYYWRVRAKVNDEWGA